MKRTLIVDDEELARQRIRMLLDELEFSTEITEAPNGKKALELISRRTPDLLLLDIQMPILDGFDVMEMLPDPKPPVIFITAYDEYALKAFEVHAIDYLLKPVRLERLKLALKRLQDPVHMAGQKVSVQRLLDEHNTGLPGKLAVEYKQEILMIDLERVFYLEADGKQTRVFTDEGRYRTNFQLHELEGRLDSQGFFRVHRSFVVNLRQIEKLEPWFKNGLRIKLKNGSYLDVARRRLSALKDRLGIK